MTQRKLIGVDFDDVLFSLNSAMTDYHNANYGTSYAYDDVRSYDLTKLWNCPMEEATRRFVEFYGTEEHANASPLPGSVDAIKRLGKVYDLVVVTSRPESQRKNITIWLKKHFGSAFKEVILTNQFGNSSVTPKKKSEVCKELGVETFIDDATHYALDIAESGVPVLLLDAPWNREMAKHPKIKRVKSWKEVERLLVNKK